MLAGKIYGIRDVFRVDFPGYRLVSLSVRCTRYFGLKQSKHRILQPPLTRPQGGAGGFIISANLRDKDVLESM